MEKLDYMQCAERVLWMNWPSDVLATVTMKSSGLKSVVVGRKLPVKLQPWIWGKQILGCSGNYLVRSSETLLLYELESINAGQFLSTTSEVHRSRQFQNIRSQESWAEGQFGRAVIIFFRFRWKKKVYVHWQQGLVT